MISTVTNAAQITILEPIDNNYKTGGGDLSVGGCLVVASKGKPFTPMRVYGGTSNLVDYFGTPLPRKSSYMEGLRHVHDASEECSYVQTVRVVDRDGYRFPSISFNNTTTVQDLGHTWTAGSSYIANEIVKHSGIKYKSLSAHTASAADEPGTAGGAAYWAVWTGEFTKSSHKWDVDVVVGTGSFLVVYPIDGDDSLNRKMRITEVIDAEKRFVLAFYEKDEAGEWEEVEKHKVGIDEDDLDDMGMSAFIETVLERDSSRFKCDCLNTTTWTAAKAVLDVSKEIDVTFVGGTAGAVPATQDWITGATVFRNEQLPLNLLFSADIDEEDVIVALADVADFRHIAFFYDIPSGLKATQAIAWNKNLGLTSRHSRAYYSPYSANDQWRGGKTVWGVSGAMAAAKARCNKTVTAGVVPGVHYAPAGETRSYLSRTGLKQLFPEDYINRDDFYDARINPIIDRTTGGCNCDDDLVQWFKTNYLRFGWINDVLDYIDHRFEEGARQVKFEPDGLTRAGLSDMTRDILEELVTSGALVTPRDPERDGTAPYKIIIEQLEIDLWKVTWEVCITGAARRIVGQPKLIK